MSTISPTEKVTCPYNKAHQIEHSRLQFHLEKCRKQYTGCKKVLCPFDSKHVVNEAELQSHMDSCPKQETILREKYVVDDIEGFVPLAEPASVVTYPQEENWDLVNYETYTPYSAKPNPHIIKKVKGATPSQRRAARMEGVRNFKPLPGAGSSGPSSPRS